MEQRIAALEQEMKMFQQEMRASLAKVERRLAIFDSYVGLMRWLAPIALGVAGILAGRLL